MLVYVLGFIDRALGQLVVAEYKNCASTSCVLKEGCLYNILCCHLASLYAVCVVASTVLKFVFILAITLYDYAVWQTFP